MRRLGKPLAAVTLALLLLATAFVLLPGASASRTPVMSASLPSAREGTTAVATDDAVYIFGGYDGDRLRDILRYDPASGTLETQDARLPSGRTMAASVWDGTHVYLFGGWSSSGFTDEILRYDPATDTLETLQATLPSPRSHITASYDGEHAYIIGGWTPSGYSREIVRYDPATDTTTTMGSALPGPRIAMGSAWTGTTLVLLGGASSGSTRHTEIFHYNPSSDTLALSDATLPSGRSHASTATVDGAVYLFGGLSCDSSPCDTILRYYPNVQELETASTLLESPRQLTSAAVLDDHVYIFGGTASNRFDEILRYSPSGAPPPVGAPELQPILDRLIQVGQTLTVDVQADHPDEAPVALSADEKPAEATFTDHGDGTGTLEWTPTDGDEGDHPVTIRASDGNKDDTESFTITVEASEALFIEAIADRTVETGTALTIEMSAVDPQGRTIALDLDPVPTGASFTDHGDGEGTFLWDVEADQEGTWDFTVSATAGDDAAQENFTLTVTELILPPELEPLQTVLFPTQTESQTLVRATHPEGREIALSAHGLPQGATFTDHENGTGTLAWTPQEEDLGGHDILIRAETHGKIDEDTLPIEVVPLYDLELESLADLRNTMAPGKTLDLLVRVGNTGYKDLKVYPQGQIRMAQEHGWRIDAPGPVDLAPGEDTTLTVQVTAPSDGTGTMARLYATGRTPEGETIRRVTNWIIDVPVIVDIHLDRAVHSPSSALTEGIQGTIDLTWSDGTPARGIDLQIAHHLAVENQAAQGDGIPPTHRTHEANSGQDGRYRFSLELEDPTALLPGEHVLTATAVRGDRTDSAGSGYRVST